MAVRDALYGQAQGGNQAYANALASILSGAANQGANDIAMNVAANAVNNAMPTLAGQMGQASQPALLTPEQKVLLQNMAQSPGLGAALYQNYVSQNDAPNFAPREAMPAYNPGYLTR